MLTVFGDHLSVVVDWVLPSYPQVKVVVLTSLQGGIENTNGIEHRSPVHHRRVHRNVVAPQQRLVVVVFDERWPKIRKWCSVERNKPVVTGDERTRWMCLQLPEPSLQCLWQQPVVGIEEHQVVANGSPYPLVTCPSQTPV